MKKYLSIVLSLALLGAITPMLMAKTGVKIFDREGNITFVPSEEIDHLEFVNDYDGTETSGSELEEAIADLDGIVKLDSEMLGESVWNEGYVTTEGFVFSSGIGNELRVMKERAAEESETVPCIGVMSKDKKDLFFLFIDEYGDPSQLVVGNNVLYFHFLGDDVLELTQSANGSEPKYVTAVHVDREAMRQTLSEGDYSFLFQTRLATVVLLLENAELPEAFNLPLAVFKTIVNLKMAKNQEATLEDLVESGLLDNKGLATFVEEVTEQFIEAVTDVRYAIVLWTGKATFKVGGTSCTLSGTIHCASPSFNELGEYGIVCDQNPDNLIWGQAEYTERGYQENGSFDVDIRGLKANTKYYYRAYYKFNDSDHGDLMFKYGEPEDNIYYDTVTKEFETGDNKLEVDVVMCIDVTGSMYNIISTVKKNALSFYDALNDKCVMNGITLTGLNNKVIAFQDINVDGSRWWAESPYYSLPSEKEEFGNFVNALYADGGGDTPESGLEALMGAFQALEDAVDDGFHRQIVILWTDAPYLIGDSYTEYTSDMVLEKWNTLSSGRRLILFAPGDDTYHDYNGGHWSVFDGTKNIIHSTKLSSSFNDFDYILDSIVEEMIGKGESSSADSDKARKLSNPNMFEIVPASNN